MQDAHGLDLAPARDQFADADQRPTPVVHSHEAARVHRRGHHGGGLPMGERRDARPVEPNDGPPGQRRLDGTHARPQIALTIQELIPGHRVVEVVGPDAPSREALDGAADAQGRAEVGGQDSDVRSLAADHPQGDARPVELLDRDRADEDLAGRALHLDAGARQLVEASPLVVDRRVHRRHLVDAADQPPAGVVETIARDLVHRRFGEDSTAHVVGVRRQPEADGREVFLLVVDEVRRQLGRLTHEHRQDPGGVRVERAGVADPSDAEPAPDDRDDVEGGRAGALVDDEDTGARGLARHDTGLPSRARLTAVSTARCASANGPATVQPEALTWPPPPNWAAMRWTSTSPLPRRLTFTWPSRSR